MKWLVASLTNEQQVFELWDEQKKLLTLEFHPSMNTARIDAAGERRVFLLRREGFLRNRVVLRNEYGMKMGQIAYEKSNVADGVLELDEERFLFSVEAINGQPELRIYRETKDVPLVISQVVSNTLSGRTLFNGKADFTDAENMLLMTSCWYITAPVKESALAYAL